MARYSITAGAVKKLSPGTKIWVTDKHTQTSFCGKVILEFESAFNFKRVIQGKFKRLVVDQDDEYYRQNMITFEQKKRIKNCTNEQCLGYKFKDFI